MRCPECGKKFEVQMNEYKEEGAEYEELDFECEDGHKYFIRVHEDDLIEVN